MIRAIFPLPVFLLPGGYTKLRIFEPRYLTMVSDALKQEQGFVLCRFEEEAPLNTPSEGIYVEIVDFSQDKGGHLLIDVHAKYRVAISNPRIDKHDLRHADIREIDQPVWQQRVDVELGITNEMSDMLVDVFAQHPQIDELYQNKHFNDPIWVASRWLELLPMKDSEKHKVNSSANFEQVVRFLHTVLYKSQ